MTLLADFSEFFFRHSRAGGNPVLIIVASWFLIGTIIQCFIVKRHAKTYATLYSIFSHIALGNAIQFLMQIQRY